MHAFDWAGSPFTGFFVGALGIALSAFFGWRQRSPKVLDYRIVADEPILSPRTSAIGRGDLAVTLQGARLVHPRLLTVRIENAGRRSVTGDDYVTPVTFSRMPGLRGYSFSEDGEGLVIDDGEVRVSDGSLVIRPKLLNPGEHFDVTLVLDAVRRPPLEVTARFADQSRPMRQRYEPILPTRIVVFGSLAMALFGNSFGIFNAAIMGVPKHPNPAAVPVAIGETVVAAAIFVSLVLPSITTRHGRQLAAREPKIR